MIGCKTCKHNKKRTVRSKNCLKNHRAVFGYNCKDYEKVMKRRCMKQLVK